MTMFLFGVSITINVILVLGIFVYFKIRLNTKKIMNENFEDMLENVLTKTDIENSFEEAIVDTKEAEEFWS